MTKHLFRGLPQVVRMEFVSNLKSPRFLIMAIMTGLAIVGSAYGLSSNPSGQSQLPPAAAWGHAAYSPNGTHLAVVWVSDPFGSPLPDRAVEFWVGSPLGGQSLLGTARTNQSGFVRFDADQQAAVNSIAKSGSAAFSAPIIFDSARNFTFVSYQWDLDGNGAQDDLAVHVLGREGEPIAASLLVNASIVGKVDHLGYGRLKLPQGHTTVEVKVANDSAQMGFFVSEGPLTPLLRGPDFVLAVMTGLASIILPIFAVVIAFDSVSKERTQGTLDLLLSRPASRNNILVGKLLGSFTVVAFPVIVVDVLGIAVIGVFSGRTPTATFALAYIGSSVFLVGTFILIQLTLSTLAKTTGISVLFGVLVWLSFGILYGVVVFVITAIVIPDPAVRFQFFQVSTLGSPTGVFTTLVSSTAPPEVRALLGGTPLDQWLPVTAALGWLVGLFLIALWTFDHRIAE